MRLELKDTNEKVVGTIELPVEELLKNLNWSGFLKPIENRLASIEQRQGPTEQETAAMRASALESFAK